MSSNIYYFDETGKPKIKNEIISVENELNSKQLKENNKLKGKSCLNIFFYTWFIIVIFLTFEKDFYKREINSHL